MRSKRQTALVIGGSGFIGPPLVALLLARGFDVTVLNRGRRPTSGVCQLIADRNSDSELRRASEQVGSVDNVIDLCCYTVAQARSAWNAFSSRCGRWLYLSSAAVYAELAHTIPTEGSPRGGAPAWGQYGAEKSAVEDFLLSRLSPIQRVSVRPPYVYGPGDMPDRETFIWARLLRHSRVLVPGTGRAVLQFVHVNDLAEALLQCLQSQESGGIAYNVAAREVISSRDYVSVLAKICNMPDSGMLVGDDGDGLSSLQYFPYPDADCHIDGSLILRECGWTPRYELMRGLAETFESYDPRAISQMQLPSPAEDQLRTFLRTRSGVT